MKQKLIAMMGSLLTACMAFSFWVGSSWASIVLLGEYSYPVEDAE